MCLKPFQNIDYFSSKWNCTKDIYKHVNNITYINEKSKLVTNTLFFTTHKKLQLEYTLTWNRAQPLNEFQKFCFLLKFC